VTPRQVQDRSSCTLHLFLTLEYNIGKGPLSSEVNHADDALILSFVLSLLFRFALKPRYN
jgi:hypothetical protein